jgi:putative transcriptional regulator
MFGRNSNLMGSTAATTGEIDPAYTLILETQAALVGTRNANGAVVATIGGSCLELETPASLRSTFSSDVLTKISAYEADFARSKAAALSAGTKLQELLDLPQPLRDLALDSAGQSGWTFAGPGVKTMKLATGGKLATKLLRIEPGHGAPNHDHTGTEYTLVVSGAFDDGTGYFGPGDLSIKRAGQIHHPIATHEGVCLALSVEEGEVAFTGALGVLQRLFTRH